MLKLDKGQFLKGWLHVRPDTASVNFLYSYISVHQSVLLCWWICYPFMILGPLALVIWKRWVYRVLQVFPDLDAFIRITTNLTKNIFKCWEAVRLIVVDINFPKFKFLLESLSFFTGNKCSVVYIEITARLHSFLRKGPRDTEVWITFVTLFTFE